jgi:hypothetical protein
MQPIFSRNDDIDKIAFLNWRIDKADDIRNLRSLADGFMLSSIRLAKLCLIYNGDKSADVLIFPIITNANHGIELYLKTITWTLNKIMNSQSRIEGSHNIKQIYDTVKAKIKKYKGQISVKDFEDNTAELQEYIVELFDKIKATPTKDNMDFSRYPFNTKYEQHFYVDLIGNVEVDLENFVSIFEKIHRNIEALSSFLYYQELNEDDHWE